MINENGGGGASLDKRFLHLCRQNLVLSYKCNTFAYE